MELPIFALLNVDKTVTLWNGYIVCLSNTPLAGGGGALTDFSYRIGVGESTYLRYLLGVTFVFFAGILAGHFGLSIDRRC